MYESIVCNYYDTVMQLVREVTRKVLGSYQEPNSIHATPWVRFEFDEVL